MESVDIMVCVNDTATTEIYTYRHTLSLHDALPISPADAEAAVGKGQRGADAGRRDVEDGHVRQIGPERRVADRRIETVGGIGRIAERARAVVIPRDDSANNAAVRMVQPPMVVGNHSRIFADHIS